MRCLSCQRETSSADLKIFDKLMLCSSCFALAESARTDIDREIARAREMTVNWLQQHIMKGGLLRGGFSAHEQLGSQLRDVLPPSEVSGLRSPPEGGVSGERNPSRDGLDSVPQR